MEQTTSAQQTGPQGTSSAGTRDPSRESHVESSPNLTQSADQALQSVGALYGAVDGALQRQLRENPYVTLAAAAGVGFLLGGGLRSPVGQLLVRFSVRTFGPQLVNTALHSALERATGSVESHQ